MPTAAIPGSCSPGGLLGAAAVDAGCDADAEAVHLAYLTPAHKRKGKGGRQPAADPRLDPGIDPKRARRILANRLSAARSKMKQKSHVEVLPACRTASSVDGVLSLCLAVHALPCSRQAGEVTPG